MKSLQAFRDGATAQRLAEEIRRICTRKWTVMEICGGQTHAIIRYGIDQLLPEQIEWVHGPGCPVCVTPIGMIDAAHALAARPEVIFCTFGDMLRVPGSRRDLFSVRAAGGDVRIVYSPLDALDLARRHPDREVVFFAVGFETTAPSTAVAAQTAQREGVKNFSLLVAHVLVPPALEAILASPRHRVQAVLAAGHVCSVMGHWQYGAVSERHRVPIVVTGFEPLDVLEGVRRAVLQLERGATEVENAFDRIVTQAGNEAAQAILAEVFETTDRAWRGIGVIPRSGWKLCEAYRDLDAEHRFGVCNVDAAESTRCRSGEVLQGLIKPCECAAFGKECTPSSPLGATMVSGEGACAAYYNYGRAAAPLGTNAVEASS